MTQITVFGLVALILKGALALFIVCLGATVLLGAIGGLARNPAMPGLLEAIDNLRFTLVGQIWTDKNWTNADTVIVVLMVIGGSSAYICRRRIVEWLRAE